MRSEARTLRHLLQRPLAARIGVIALLFVLWEIAARWWIDPMFLSPPSHVFASLPAVLVGTVFGLADTEAELTTPTAGGTDAVSCTWITATSVTPATAISTCRTLYPRPVPRFTTCEGVPPSSACRARTWARARSATWM